MHHSYNIVHRVTHSLTLQSSTISPLRLGNIDIELYEAMVKLEMRAPSLAHTSHAIPDSSFHACMALGLGFNRSNAPVK